MAFRHAQMELFAKMLETKKAESLPKAGSHGVDQELCMAKLTDRDNIEPISQRSSV